MPSDSLTPKLRTRLNRMERVVGVFVILAVLLFAAGFAYYLHQAAARKGWFLQKVPYYIYVEDASGLHLGDPVRMMGFDIGRITAIRPSPPTDWFVANRYNVFVQFEILEPNYGYIWTDSKVKVVAGDILGGRVLEVVKGQTGSATVSERNEVVTHFLYITNLLQLQNPDPGPPVPLEPDSKGVWLPSLESAVVSERVSQLVGAVERALPALTNQLLLVLSSGDQVLSNVNTLALQGHGVATNLTLITERLREPGNALGRWIFPTNFEEQLQTTLTAAESAMTGVDSNLLVMVEKLGVSLDHLAEITAHLHRQVQSNTNVLSEISQAVLHTDELVQGLKRHWFLRSAFKTNRPPASPNRK